MKRVRRGKPPLDDSADRFGTRSILIAWFFMNFGQSVDCGKFGDLSDPDPVCKEAMTFAHAATVVAQMPNDMVDEIIRQTWPMRNNDERIYQIMEWVAIQLEKAAA